MGTRIAVSWRNCIFSHDNSVSRRLTASSFETMQFLIPEFSPPLVPEALAVLILLKFKDRIQQRSACSPAQFPNKKQEVELIPPLPTGSCLIFCFFLTFVVAGAFALVKDAFADADSFWGHFTEFVVIHEFQRLFQVQDARFLDGRGLVLGG